jgi:UDP-glucose 4-epimerase
LLIHLVTGGASFIGNSIARELLKRSKAVRILDNFSTECRYNTADIRSDIEVVEGDLRSFHMVNVLFVAMEQEVRRLIFAASFSICGNAPVQEKSEELLVRTLSPYAVSKLAGEKYLQVFLQINELETVACATSMCLGRGRWDPNRP